jgi:hypothetical protein
LVEVVPVVSVVVELEFPGANELDVPGGVVELNDPNEVELPAASVVDTKSRYPTYSYTLPKTFTRLRIFLL